MLETERNIEHEGGTHSQDNPYKELISTILTNNKEIFKRKTLEKRLNERPEDIFSHNVWESVISSNLIRNMPKYKEAHAGDLNHSTLEAYRFIIQQLSLGTQKLCEEAQSNDPTHFQQIKQQLEKVWGEIKNSTVPTDDEIIIALWTQIVRNSQGMLNESISVDNFHAIMENLKLDSKKTNFYKNRLEVILKANVWDVAARVAVSSDEDKRTFTMDVKELGEYTKQWFTKLDQSAKIANEFDAQSSSSSLSSQESQKQKSIQENLQKAFHSAIRRKNTIVAKELLTGCFSNSCETIFNQNDTLLKNMLEYMYIRENEGTFKTKILLFTPLKYLVHKIFPQFSYRWGLYSGQEKLDLIHQVIDQLSRDNLDDACKTVNDNSGAFDQNRLGKTGLATAVRNENYTKSMALQSIVSHKPN